MQNVIAELNLSDLARQTGLRLSGDLRPRDLTNFANAYGYLLPERAEEEFGELEGWDAWVLILAAAEGRCILRAKFGEATVTPPVIGDKLRKSRRE